MFFLREYENQGFEQNPADYVLLGLEFIGTCGSFPEQYDVVKDIAGMRYQVGYVRLRGGKFSVYSPDLGYPRAPVFQHTFEETMGCFKDEDTRLKYLAVAAKVINYELINLKE